MNGREHAWAIVLAGGDGLRLSAWTEDPSGRAVPKQYCSFGRPRSMLRWAIERACSVVPREHVLIVVAEQHRRFWEHELSDFPLENIVVQPRNRGTGAGLLLPLLRLCRHRDAVARVLVLASDHYVEDEPTLREILDVALNVRGRRPGRLLLMGMTPSGLDHDFGWIVPASRASGGIRRVAHFAEKPGPEGARVLMRRGALVNSLILVAPVDLILRLYQETLPGILGALLDCPGDAVGRERLAEIYESIPTSDFSRHVLARSVRHLSVVQVPWCGWSDLGTPDRLRRFGFRRPSGVLVRTPEAAGWLDTRMAPGQPGSPSRWQLGVRPSGQLSKGVASSFPTARRNLSGYVPGRRLTTTVVTSSLCGPPFSKARTLR